MTKVVLIVLASLVVIYVVLDHLPHTPIRASIGG
jgi:preprotein translocase subunit SecE